MKNIKIEAEGSELILKNSAGDHVIIPKKYRQEVLGMIKDDCHGCIDALVNTLPVMSDYAEDGTLIPKDPPRTWADDATDLGTGILNSVKTFGGSAIGDAIDAFSPEAADAVEKYSLGFIPHTTNEQREGMRVDNPNAWKNAVGLAAEAGTSVIAGKIIGGVANKAVGWLTPEIENAGSKIPGMITDNAFPKGKVNSSTLEEPPIEVILDEGSINLQRNVAKKIKDKIPYDKEDLGNGLILYKNASRQANDKDILGTNRALKSIKNTSANSNEQIDLKSWKDGDEVYYYFSANMPSSKIKAGRAYMELEKHIPKGAKILESSSLSMDSFNNILKQLKNPKFQSSVEGTIPLNNMSITKGVPNSSKQSVWASSNQVLFDQKDEAERAVRQINDILKEHNLPMADIVDNKIRHQPAAHLPYEDKMTYGIELPNIALKKLYGILGIAVGEGFNEQQSKSEE